MEMSIVAPTFELPGCYPVLEYATATDDEWHAIRRQGWGGSDAAALLELDPHSSAFVKVAEKTGRLPKWEGNEATAMGTIMEPHIRRHILPEYLRENEIGFVEVYDPTHTYRSKEREHELVNVDGFVMLESGELCGLEIKYHGGHRLREYGGVDGDEVPDAYYCQAQHGMSCTGLKMWMHFAIEGHRRIIRWIPRNDEFIAWLRSREKHYWEIVQYNDPLLFPAPGGTDADMDALMEMGSPEMGGVIDLSDAEELLEQYETLGEEVRDRQSERDQIKQQIIYYLGQYRKGETDNYRVGFTRTEQRRVDVDKLRRDHRETVEEYTTWAEVGRLSVRRRGK